MAVPQEPQEALLAGLTVLDMSQGIAGPYCGLLLRQQGARVIKVEPPSGDWSRHMGRALHGQTAIAIACNAGKESIVLDTRTGSGRGALHALARRADVVIQNFRPGVAARLGAGHAELAALNPRQVYVSISGYGSDGPLASLPVLDTNMQAVGGLMHTNRDPSGQPRRIGFFVVDLSTALYAAQCATAALYRAAVSGRGGHVEVSMLQVSAALQSYIVIDDAMFPQEEATAFNAPTGLFQAADGLLYVSMLDDAMFERLARLLGCEDWLADAGLRTSAGRIPRAAELNRRLAQRIAGDTLAQWEARLRSADVLFGRVQHPRALRAHPQALHSGLFTELSQPGLGPLPWSRLPGQSVADPAALQAPTLGQHTDPVLKEFGLA
jgi:CoA:oxalate CoA-transferase